MAYTATVKTPLRRSFSEHVKDSTNRAWDVFWKSTRERRLWEIEAKEACDWLGAAGFPQYVQLFKDCRFPIDIEWARTDHDFLDKDALDSLCRRLSTLNKCVEMRLELGRSKHRGDHCDDDDPCAISNKWTYDRRARRWQRHDITLDFLPFADSPVGRQETSLCSSNDRHDVCSLHSTSSTESEGQEGGLKTHRDPNIPTINTTTISTTNGQETIRSSSRCSSTSKTPSLDTSFSGPPSPGGGGDGYGTRESSTLSLEAEHCFPGKPPRKKGPSLLRKIEKLRLRGTSTLRSPTHGSGSRAQLVISEPVFLEGPMEEERLRRLQCPASLQGRPGSQTSSSSLSSPHTGSSSSSSSSPSASSSTASTPSPVTRVRSNYRRNGDGTTWNNQNQELLLHSGTEDFRNQINNNNNSRESLVFQVPHGHKPGTFPTTLTHKDTILSPIFDNTSINWRTGSFHGYRCRRSCRGDTSPLATKDQEDPASSSDVSVPSPLALLDPRVSIYDNVPVQQLLGSSGGSGGSGRDVEQEVGETKAGQLISEADMFSALDSVMERISDLQQMVSSWAQDLSEDDCQRETSSSSSSSSTSSGDSPAQASSSPSPCPSSPSHIHLEIQEAEEGTESCEKDEEEAKTRAIQQLRWCSQQSLPLVPPCPGLESQSVSNIHLLQKLSLLKLTALMDKYSPSSKQGWNWTVPKPLRKTKLSEVKGRRVFGVPLAHSTQQTGEALPPSILRALVYLRTECLDQVGLFRRSGVKSRIQYLRDLVESDPDGVSFEGQSAFDVADLVKQYFRDLPEPVFSSRLSETFLHIYQYFPKDQHLVAVQAAILLLPDESREALRTLLLFLRDVVACVKENQMTPTNIAVCLVPSLFHLNTLKRDTNAARSGHRKYSLGRPDQRDLTENLAATQGLAHMVTEAQRLFQLPEFWPGRDVRAGRHGDDSLSGDRGVRGSLPQGREEEQEEEEERRSRLELSTQHLLREAREKSKGWEAHSAPDHVDLAFKKVDDGCTLRLWRGSVEVDAPVEELFHRLLREQGLWETTLRQAGVVQTLSKNSEVYRYLLRGQSLGPGSRPPQEHLLLRTWQSDPSLGPLYLSSVSMEHPDVPLDGVRVQVHACLYLLEPQGVRSTRLTHLCRTDTRGRSQEWYNRVSGHLLASKLMAIRDSFHPDHRETKI